MVLKEVILLLTVSGLSVDVVVLNEEIFNSFYFGWVWWS